MKISTAVITVVAAFASFTNAHSSKSTTDTYDYVIVGGGVAGTIKFTFIAITHKFTVISSL